jgi:ribosomal protein S18 acetylase RimI-like enzyme
MINQVQKQDLKECVSVIKRSFQTVADKFNITVDNAQRYVAFATTEEKLSNQLDNGRLMFASYMDNKIVGYYSLCVFENECEISNLCVLPEYRHLHIGSELLNHAIGKAQECNLFKVNISIVEENIELRKWYEKFGFVHTETKKFDFFPFTCGYMEYYLK